MEVVIRDSLKPAVRGEIPVAVCGLPRTAVYRRSSPPFAAHPDTPFAGNGSAACGEDGSATRGDDDAAARGDDDTAARNDEGSVARGDDDDAAARGFPRPAKGRGTRAFGGPGYL